MQIDEPDPFELISAARKALGGDMRKAFREMLRASPEEVQFWRRTLIRSVFAYIEVTTYFLRSAALSATTITGVELSDAEKALLREESYVLDARGRAKARPYFPSMEQGTRFSLACFCKAHEIKPVDLSDKGWEAFKIAIETRNRTTHPRFLVDVEVSKEEAWGVMLAGFWISRVTGALIDAGVERLLQESPLPGSA